MLKLDGLLNLTVPGDTLWSDSATGDSGSRGHLLLRAKLWELQVLWIGCFLGRLPVLVEGNSHLYLLLLLYILIFGFIELGKSCNSLKKKNIRSRHSERGFIKYIMMNNVLYSYFDSLNQVRVVIHSKKHCSDA